MAAGGEGMVEGGSPFGRGVDEGAGFATTGRIGFSSTSHESFLPTGAGSMPDGTSGNSGGGGSSSSQPLQIPMQWHQEEQQPQQWSLQHAQSQRITQRLPSLNLPSGGGTTGGSASAPPALPSAPSPILTAAGTSGLAAAASAQSSQMPGSRAGVGQTTSRPRPERSSSQVFFSTTANEVPMAPASPSRQQKPWGRQGLPWMGGGGGGGGMSGFGHGFQAAVSTPMQSSLQLPSSLAPSRSDPVGLRNFVAAAGSTLPPDARQGGGGSSGVGMTSTSDGFGVGRPYGGGLGDSGSGRMGSNHQHRR